MNLRWLLLFVLLLSCTQVFSQQAIVIDNDLFGKYIGKTTSLYIDKTGSQSFNDVAAHPEYFAVSSANVVNFGVSESNYWVKFKVKNYSAIEKLILNLDNPIIDRTWFYVVHSDGAVDSSSIFEVQPVRYRKHKNQSFLFDINLRNGDSAVCYLKLWSPKQVLVPLSIGPLDFVLHSISNFDLLSGIYYGIMLVMFLYNIFIFVTVRDDSYMYYVIYIFSVAITQSTLQGYDHRFLWPDNVWLTRNMLYITGSIAGITTVIFTKSFLHTAKNIPKLNVALNLIILGDIVALVFLFSGHPSLSYNAVNITAGLGSLIVIYSASTLFKKFRPARFYLISYSVFLTGVIVFVLKDFSVVRYDQFTSHSLQIGSAIEAMLLSFALADKINIFRKEKEDSQKQAFEALEENERIIRGQNVMLEGKVEVRTHELRQSKEELEHTLQELKDTQSQLIEQEKMASLGQLTAGVAHEINNPINFVTSNVKPLNRDVRMVLDAFEQFELLAMEQIPQDKKRQKIEDLKMEIDFDYLKIEIDQLLKGIGDGASRTAEIVKGLRIFSRLDEDALKKADINEGIDSTLVITNNLLGEAIKLEKKYANLPLVDCFPGKLNQVFLNIISNAIHALNKKYDRKPGGVLSITTYFDEKYVYVSIRDNGPGIEDAVKKRIFEPFFTTKEVGEGTGLGLSIAYNTISKHSGQIIVNSEVGVGTEFILKLPIIQA